MTTLEKIRAEIGQFADAHCSGDDINIYDVFQIIDKYAEQEQTGHWILLDECANSGYYCSECQKKLVKEGWSETVKKIKYCPNCGAKMVEPQESETWHGIHAQITAPKGTFERIFNEADDDYDI